MLWLSSSNAQHWQSFFYLPREFNCVVIVAVYIPPSANAKHALNELHNAISEQQTTHLAAFFTV